MKVARVVVAAGVAVAAGLWYWWSAAPRAGAGLMASGTVEATETQVGFVVAGRLLEVSVREGDHLEGGAAVARLDDAELAARHEQAVAQLAAAKARLAELERGARREEIRQARAAVDGARSQLVDAVRDQARNERLLAAGAISRERLEKAAVALEVARSRTAEASERLRLLEAGTRPEQLDAQRAQVAAADAAARALAAGLGNAVITAPAPGVVTARHREPGEIVAPGAPVVTLLNPADRWVRIYVPEHRLGAIALGSAATISSDTYPGRRYPGKVTFIASEAEFTPKNVQTTEERVRLVYAVKVSVEQDRAMELKPGMPVDVTLELAGPPSSPGAPHARR